MNRWPLGYEPSALTWLSYRPSLFYDVIWRYYIFKYAFNNNIFAYAFLSWKEQYKNTKFTPLAGLEPTTFWLTARHSTSWVKAAHVIGCALFAHPIANTPKAIIIFIYFAWNCFDNYVNGRVWRSRYSRFWWVMCFSIFYSVLIRNHPILSEGKKLSSDHMK